MGALSRPYCIDATRKRTQIGLSRLPLPAATKEWDVVMKITTAAHDCQIEQVRVKASISRALMVFLFLALGLSGCHVGSTAEEGPATETQAGKTSVEEPDQAADATESVERTPPPTMSWVEVGRLSGKSTDFMRSSSPFEVQEALRASFSFDFDSAPGYIYGWAEVWEANETNECDSGRADGARDRLQVTTDSARSGVTREFEVGPGRYCGYFAIQDQNLGRGNVTIMFEDLRSDTAG